MYKMKLLVQSYDDKATGTKLHVIYDKKSQVMQVCLWESLGGRLVSLDADWLADYKARDISPIPDLIAMYPDVDEDEVEDEDDS